MPRNFSLEFTSDNTRGKFTLQIDEATRDCTSFQVSLTQDGQTREFALADVTAPESLEGVTEAVRDVLYDLMLTASMMWANSEPQETSNEA